MYPRPVPQIVEGCKYTVYEHIHMLTVRIQCIVSYILHVQDCANNQDGVSQFNTLPTVKLISTPLIMTL